MHQRSLPAICSHTHQPRQILKARRFGWLLGVFSALGLVAGSAQAAGLPLVSSAGVQATAPAGPAAPAGAQSLAGPMSPRYTDNGDGTVTDSQTGLVWEFDADASSDRSSTCSANQCDWRIPLIMELQSILSCGISPCIDPTFGTQASSIYWSSASWAGHPLVAWLVVFGNGYVNHTDKEVGGYARAVRGAGGQRRSINLAESTRVAASAPEHCR